MAKQGGLGQRLLTGGFDISGDIQALENVHGGPAGWDTTDITQSAHARMGLQRDGGLGATVYFDPANAHPVLSALPTADVATAYLFNPLTVGSPAACCVAKQIGYDPTRAANGALTLKTQFDANGFGLEWGVQLTPGLRTDGAATAASAANSFDTGAAASFGAQAYLQVVAFAGTSVTLTVFDSADNVTFAAVSGLAFTAVTAAPAAQRIAVVNTATVRRYVAVASSGTFTNAKFAVVLVKNQVAGVTF